MRRIEPFEWIDFTQWSQHTDFLTLLDPAVPDENMEVLHNEMKCVEKPINNGKDTGVEAGGNGKNCLKIKCLFTNICREQMK